MAQIAGVLNTLRTPRLNASTPNPGIVLNNNDTFWTRTMTGPRHTLPLITYPSAERDVPIVLND